MIMYVIYINLVRGRTGYYVGLDDYDFNKREFQSVVYSPDCGDSKQYPTYDSALSYAMWLKENYSNVIYAEVIDRYAF